MTCCQIGCNEEATHEITWPGQLPKPVCEKHSRKAVSLGNAFGLVISVRRLDNGTNTPDGDRPAKGS